MKQVPKTLQFLLYLFIFTIPIENSFTLIPGTSLSSLSGGLLIVFFIFYAVSRKIHILSIPKIFYLYIILLTISIVFAQNITIAGKGLITYILLFIFLHILFSIIKDKKILYNVLLSFTISALVCMIGVFINYQTIKITSWWQPRTSSFGADSNVLATILSLANVMLFMLKNHINKKYYNTLFIVYSILFPFSIILLASRTGMLVAFVSYFPLISRLKKSFIPIIVTFSLILLGISYTPLSEYLPEANIQRLLETTNHIETGDFTNRETFWKYAILSTKKHPFFGVGISNFSVLADRKFRTKGAVTHNTYLSIFVETGIFVFLTFLILIYKLYASVRNKWRNEKIYGYSLLLIILTAMLTLTIEYYKITWLLYFIILCHNNNNKIKTNEDSCYSE